MCRGCDIDTGPGWGEIWELSDRDERTLQKRSQLDTLKRLLAPYRLQHRALPGGDSFTLTSLTGSSRVVHGVRHLWPAVTELTGTPVDVLNPEFLAPDDPSAPSTPDEQVTPS